MFNIFVQKNNNFSKAFTLIEMLAVIGIMLVLMVVAFGALSLFSSRLGPDEAVASIQGILNGARSYGAANVVSTRVEFSLNIDPSEMKPIMQDGTVVTIKYLPPGSNSQSPGDWREIPGMSRFTMGNGIFVIKGIPVTTGVVVPNSVGSDKSVQWRDYEKQLLKKVNDTVLPLRINSPWPYIEFDPIGYLVENIPSSTQNGMADVQGLTVVQVVGTQVTQYKFFLLNSYSGTRIVFD
jgi:prepilin-type N-terminal cleavage/methylation domain-containing protein